MDLPTRQDADGGIGEDRERRKKAEMVQEAIHGLLEERRRKRQLSGEEEEEGEGEDRVILSSLLSELDDALEKDADKDKDNAEQSPSHANSETRDGENIKEVKLGDIAKDLNKIKRQNLITHVLLGTVIVMTAVWQFNEVSFLLAVQEKLSNPLKSLGELIKGALKGRGRKPVIEAPPLPPVGIPDVTRHDLQMLVIRDDDD